MDSTSVHGNGNPRNDSLIGLNLDHVYPDIHVVRLLQVGDKRRQKAVVWLRAKKLLIENGRHPIAKGSDWLEALKHVKVEKRKKPESRQDDAQDGTGGTE